MSMVSHLCHLFHPETCQSYIHTLRWKDRRLQLSLSRLNVQCRLNLKIWDYGANVVSSCFL